MKRVFVRWTVIFYLTFRIRRRKEEKLKEQEQKMKEKQEKLKEDEQRISAADLGYGLVSCM